MRYLRWAIAVTTLVAVPAMSHAQVCSSVLCDSFNDNTVNTALWNAFPEGTGPSIAETNGRVEITIPSSASGVDQFGGRYQSACQLNGDFDIQVGYELLAWPFSNGVRVGLSTSFEQDNSIATRDGVARISFGTPVDFPGSPREAYVSQFNGSVQGVSATADTSGILRLVRIGSTMTAYHQDGIGWVTIASDTVTIADVFFILRAHSEDRVFSDFDTLVAFDDFLVSSGTVICPSPICGDGVVTTPEVCDDGNLENGDCCSSTCDSEGSGSACTGPGKCGDLDGSGSIATTDALLLLQSAVGQPVALMCPAAGLPQTGQTTAFGTGSDGNVQAGVALSYTDNGDGTITDHATGLMWEKKDDSGGIHDLENVYTWSTGTNDMDGTIVTTFLNTLNDLGGGGTSCFAGHCDWRVPNYRELTTIQNLGAFNPNVDPVFNIGCAPGCSGLICSCTSSVIGYWTSTTLAGETEKAWAAGFGGGGVGAFVKTSLAFVRAVRGRL